jgi:hypothetical protein
MSFCGEPKSIRLTASHDRRDPRAGQTVEGRVKEVRTSPGS